MAGYWNRPEETAKVMTPDGFFRGDIGFMTPEGYVKIVDRKKDMILVSGFTSIRTRSRNVVTLPGVLEGAAIGRTGPAFGETVKLIHRQERSEPDEADVKAHCAKGLPLQAAEICRVPATACRKRMSARSCARN